MKTFVAIAFAAIAIPSVMCFFDGTSGITFPFLTIGGTTSSTAATGLAITGLSSGAALAAGLGGVVAAIGAGALAGGVLAAATRRGKRSVVDDELIGEEFIFEAINKMDEKDCGKRYVCELAATPVELLSQTELTSLLLFQTRSPVANSGKSKFDEAIRLGVLSRNPKVCEKRYATCPNKA